MMSSSCSAYLRLMRFHQPIGIVLLWCPTAWALWTAGHGAPSWRLFLIFLSGTIIMRTAGCIVNDMSDRDFDKYVERTQCRPLARGDLSLKQAFLPLIALLMSALFLLLQLPVACFGFALAALGLTLIYPLCKRYIAAPQLVLGTAFSMGIPMAYAALQAPFDASFYCLFCLNVLWIIEYDTAYAMADKPDDIRIGVKSTAIWFGLWDVRILTMLMVSISGLWLLFAYFSDLSPVFYLFWFLSLVMFWGQYCLIKTRQREQCFRAFQHNAFYGLWMWGALFISQTF